MLAILKRELRNYFLTPIGYVFLGIFLVMSGVFFFLGNMLSASADLEMMFGNMSYLFMLVVPLLTMKLLSEERRNKTDQLLLTSPLSIWSVVSGKFLAACGVLLFGLFATTFSVVIITTYSTPYIGVIVSNYIGFFLLGCSYIAIGVLMSAFSENQIVAAVLTLGVNLLLQLIESVVPSLTIPFMTWLPSVFSWLSLYTRYYSFTAGIISIANIIYYVSFCGIILFLTVRVIDKRRWSE